MCQNFRLVSRCFELTDVAYTSELKRRQKQREKDAKKAEKVRLLCIVAAAR